MASTSLPRVATDTSIGVHDYTRDGVRVAPPARATVAADLLTWARRKPDSPYVTWCSNEGETRILTYGELEKRSRRLAASLVAAAGPGTTVGLIPGNDLPSVVALFAALRAQTPCLILNPNDPVRRLRSILEHHSVGTCLRSPHAGAHTAPVADVIPWDTDGAHTDADTPPDPADAQSASCPALLFGTSGSTAASKVVVQPHRALTSNAEAVAELHRLDPASTLMGGLPIYHVNGVHFSLIASLHAGAHLILPQEISPFTYRGLLDAHRPNLASVVPTVLEGLLAAGRGWRPPGSLRYFVSAAAPLTASIIARVWNAFGVRVLQGYGLTETSNFSTTVPADLPDEVYRAVAVDAEIPSVGVAVPGNEVEILSADGAVLGERERGEICMRGHNVMQGYAGRPDLTAEAFAGGWFHSGDLGYWAAAADGRRYFYITGRSKNIAKVRGETVSLEEIERALLSIDAVTDAGCVALPHPTWGEQIVALVATREELAGIRAELAGLVPPGAMPARWYVLDEIPRTATGKLQRPRLAELVRDRTAP